MMFGWIRTGLLSLFKDKPGEVPFLHGARATAIILVTIMHFWEFKRAAGMPEHPGWVDTILDGFTSGVDLFFVISGFLIYGILRREYLDRGLLRYRNFYFRRFMRIVPGYAAFLFVTVLSAFYYYSRQPVFGGQANIVLAGVRRVWADALFLSDYLPSMHVHTWSVAVEEKFYILLPIAAGFLIFKLGLRARLIIWTTGIIIVTVVRYLEFQAFSISALNFKQYLYFPAHARLDSFLIGILIAELEIHSYILALGKRAGAVAAILTTSIILLAAAHMVSLAEYPLFFSVFRFNALGIGFGGLVLTGLASQNLFTRILQSIAFRPIARLSYQMYLWGPAGTIAAISRFHRPGWPGVFETLTATFFFVIVFALIAYVVVEAPAIRLRGRIERHFFRGEA